MLWIIISQLTFGGYFHDKIFALFQNIYLPTSEFLVFILPHVYFMYSFLECSSEMYWSLYTNIVIPHFL